MADQQYLVGGVQVNETSDGEYFVLGVQLNETQATGATCALSGTAADTINEDDIKSGGETIILTLTDDTWVATVGADNGITDALIAGLDGTGSGAGSWDDEVIDDPVGGSDGSLTHANIVRDGDNVTLTITLPATEAYDISAQETITAVVPASALTGAAEITASPTFTIDAVASGVTIPRGLSAIEHGGLQQNIHPIGEGIIA